MNWFRNWWRERFSRWWSDYQLPIIIVAGLFALGLGFVGFSKNGTALGETRSLFDNFYLTLGLLSMNTGAVPPPVPWELEVARFLVPLIAAYTAVIALAAVFTQQAQQVRLQFYRDHIIICGLSQKGIRLASQFSELGERVVIIEADEGNDWIDTVRASGIVVLNGDATDPDMLRKARANRAKYLIAVTGSDGVNAEVAVRAEQLSLKRDSGVLTCIIHIVDPQLWHLLRKKELYVDPESHFRLELFNIYDRGAYLMLQAHSPWLQDLSNNKKPNRVVIIGLGKLGESLIIQAALQWQQKNPKASRLHFSIVDLAAEEKIRSLCTRYQHLEEICHLEPLEMNVHSSAFHQAKFLENNNPPNPVSAIYICMDNDALVLHIGLIMHQKVKDSKIPVVVRMVENAGLALLIGHNDHGNNAYENLHAFPLLDQTCTPDLVLYGTHEVIARALHDAYLESLQPQQGKGWEKLAEDTKEWNRKQADRISIILEKHGYRISPLINWKASDLVFIEAAELDEVEKMARMEHDLWCLEMQTAGWRYGAARSKERKTNPDLVSWEDLPDPEVEKNKNFIRRLPKILAGAGFQIEKKNSTHDDKRS